MRVLRERDGAIDVIRLNRPEKLNALDLQMKRELGEAIAAASADPRTRVVLLCAEGRAFCAGADLRDLAPQEGLAYRETLRQLQQDLIVAIATSSKPFVAAVQGLAVGGGFSLALACDVVVAATSASFGCGFAYAAGVAADLGIAFFLPRAIGYGRARAALLTGTAISAGDAHAWGLAHALVEDAELLAAARTIAQRMVTGAPQALAATKRLLLAAQHSTFLDVLAAEADLQALLRLTADHQEAVAAFAERRPPRFAGG